MVGADMELVTECWRGDQELKIQAGIRGRRLTAATRAGAILLLCGQDHAVRVEVDRREHADAAIELSIGKPGSPWRCQGTILGMASGARALPTQAL